MPNMTKKSCHQMLGKLDYSNKKQVLELVAFHLAQQDAKSTFGQEHAYRGDDGFRCSIGILIPDEVYDPACETWPIKGRVNIDSTDPADTLSAWFMLQGADLEFLVGLQSVHDDVEVSHWMTALVALARVHQIDASVYLETLDATLQLSSGCLSPVQQLAVRAQLQPPTWFTCCYDVCASGTNDDTAWESWGEAARRPHPVAA